LDEAHGLIRATASGEISSPDFVDRSIAYFTSLGEPWRYNRLNDLSDCTGFVSYEDLSRMARFFAPMVHLFPSPRKVAVVSRNRLVHARIPTIDQLFTDQMHRAFLTIDEAEAWLAN
jgi:hypothetical protein